MLYCTISPKSACSMSCRFGEHPTGTSVVAGAWALWSRPPNRRTVALNATSGFKVVAVGILPDTWNSLGHRWGKTCVLDVSEFWVAMCRPYKRGAMQCIGEKWRWNPSVWNTFHVQLPSCKGSSAAFVDLRVWIWNFGREWISALQHWSVSWLPHRRAHSAMDLEIKQGIRV